MTQFDLRREDCVKGMSRLPGERIDLVVTSPPYNLGIRYGRFSDRQDRRSYLRWCREWAAHVRRVMKPGGSFFLNIGAAPSNPMLPHEIAIELRDVFVLQNTIHWIKSITIEDRDGDVRSYGHFKPISSKRFLNDCHEYIFHFTKTGHVEISECHIRIRAISLVGRTRAGAICVAEETRGSSLTRRFRGGRRSGRTRRRFRCS